MTEDTQTPTSQPTADDSPSTAGHPPVEDSIPAGGASVQERALALANERPEVAVGAAFAGGLVFAMILKRLAR